MAHVIKRSKATRTRTIVQIGQFIVATAELIDLYPRLFASPCMVVVVIGGIIIISTEYIALEEGLLVIAVPFEVSEEDFLYIK